MIRIVAVAAAIAAGCGGAPVAGSPSCAGLEITDPDQLAGLEGCEAIAGDLAIAGAALTEIDGLAALVEIRGDLTVGPTSRLASARGLANLARVSGSVDIARNFELGGVFLGRLAEVGGAVRIERNLSLSTASLHRLQTVGGDLVIGENGGLARIDLSALSEVGGDLEIRGRGPLVVVVNEAVVVGGRRHIDAGQPRKTP